MENLFDSIRVYKNSAPTHSHYLERNEIEFVLVNSKRNYLFAHMFGNVYNLARSRYEDEKIVYCPQDYGDFIAFLQEIKTNPDHSVDIYRMDEKSNDENKYEPHRIRGGIDVLVKYASNIFLDTTLSEEDQLVKKEKFLKKCDKILSKLGVNGHLEK